MPSKAKGVFFDLVGTFDPRVVPTAALKGTVFRYVPPSGLAELLVKQDDNLSTAWASTSEDNQAFVYYVTPGTGNFPTIQSAIDQAFADGSGPVSGRTATIFVPPGQYTENLTFRPGQTIIGQTSRTSIGAVRIIGQHTYTPPANTDPLSVIVSLDSLSLFDPDNGDTIRVLGGNDFFFSVLNCAFGKSSATGSSVYVANTSPNGIFVAIGCSTTFYLASDPWLVSFAQTSIVTQCIHTSGSPAPIFDYQGVGTLLFSDNQCVGNAPWVMRTNGGSCFFNFNFMASLAPNNDCIRVGAGATVFLTNSILVSNIGTGYAIQGSGIVNGALIAYGISNAKDPALTFNLLPTDP